MLAWRFPSHVLGWVKWLKCFPQSFNNSVWGHGGNEVPDKEGLPSLITGSWFMGVFSGLCLGLFWVWGERVDERAWGLCHKPLNLKP